MFLGMAASQPNKATTKLVDDSGSSCCERPGWLEVGLRKVREQEARLATERESKIFRKRKRKEEEEECTSKRKDKGKGHSSTQ